MPEAAPSLPVSSFMKISEAGEPYLEGMVCAGCAVVSFGRRIACPRCGERAEPTARRLSSEGSLYAFSIVYRSFPGIAVPFVSAVVDLDGGGTLKGNLIGVEPNPERIKPGMRVQVVFGDALGRRDKQGRSYSSYFFQAHESGAPEIGV